MYSLYKRHTYTQSSSDSREHTPVVLNRDESATQGTLAIMKTVLVVTTVGVCMFLRVAPANWMA